jgi:crossover junction endodeoxyribonuclease RusA
MKVSLPFPDKILSPNARPHWAALAKAKKAYRRACYWSARPLGLLDATVLHVTITFNPPLPRRARDEDNMVASFKSGADGVADAITVDDSKWRVTHAFGEPVKGGTVTIEITGVEK